MNKKIIFPLIVAIVIIVAIVSFVMSRNSDSVPTHNKNESDISVIGTWYSDKPDTVNFTKDGKYSFSSWNGGSPWLTFTGTYNISEKEITLESPQDGKTVLTIEKSEDGSICLVGRYTYYQTEEKAKKAAEIAKEETEQEEANIIPNTINNLIGEWTSIDKTVTCSFTESSITVIFKGNDVLPTKTSSYEYELVNDKLISISQNDVVASYPYTLTEKNGVYTLHCTGLNYAPTYTKDTSSTSSTEETNATIKKKTSTVISSEKNPDKSEYTGELTAYVNETLIGTWKGTFDEWPTINSVYWVYTFTSAGTYNFTNDSTSESGTYTTTSNPNNNDYHSELTLSFKDGQRTEPFYFTTSDPMTMITADQTDPTFIKQ